MRLSRRRLFTLLVPLWPLAWLGTSRARPIDERSEPLAPVPLETLSAYLDTLIPADATPAASGLGIPERVLAEGRPRREHRALLAAGSAWLDREARARGAAGFAALDEPARVALVTLAAGSPARTVPRKFFEVTRDDAMFFYYAHPASWPVLGYDGPPQPRGFPDQAAPPRPRGP